MRYWGLSTKILLITDLYVLPSIVYMSYLYVLFDSILCTTLFDFVGGGTIHDEAVVVAAHYFKVGLINMSLKKISCDSDWIRRLH